jgi:hypothetical protein
MMIATERAVSVAEPATDGEGEGCTVGGSSTVGGLRPP